MKMKHFLFAIIIITFLGCKGKETEKVEEQQVVHPNSTTFYKTEAGADAIQVAERIVYDVVMKNSSTEDTEWNDGSYFTSVTNVDAEAIANIIFQAVYEQRLVAYNVIEERAMTIEEVKQMDLTYDRKQIAKIQFVEKWLFNENTLEMSKIVSEIELGYEKTSETGEVLGYKRCFKVYLTDKEKNIIAK